MAEAVHSIADELKKLHELLELGVISKEDFERAKKKMITGVSAPEKLGREQPEVELDTTSVPPDRVKEGLRDHQKWRDATCMECGYVGKMGVLGRHLPWYLTLWMIIPLLLFVVFGWLIIILLAILRAQNQTFTLECPNCRKVLVTRTT